ncbi:MAG: outer membrane protein assembly factor BamC [Betaproteobacteria bacterium]|nr:outer membrane protein assembly factor BamC [Betaproteobacteria bacterium]MDE2123375.1 outer membrane protein assembly factor BamC [Betaproteobacteria bacterium]MDE2187363.1 outer membrane protein assembly factor BamC [Betaproteobacteria bacterium]MDE2323088.1 outer membrane protein assembly factor BamC [Betaproteobacteria bacterium]
MRRTPVLHLSALALALASLGGCSSLNTVVTGKSVDYEGAKAGPDLVVPPDLTQLAREQRYTMSEGGTKTGPVSALAYQNVTTQQAQAVQSNAVLPQYPGMRIEQAGGQRWLVVDTPPDKLWDTVKEFWQQNGFYLTKADATTGDMETDWAENRAKLPQDFIRKYLGKVFDSMYDTGERDRFRTVFERTPDGKGTEIFITHQTMVEVYTNQDKTQTTWQPGTPDPTLDTVFLRKLMVRLGMNETQAKAAVADAVTPATAVHASLIDNGRALQVQDGFDEAWRKVGLAINTAGFTVTDRNRSAGAYDIRYVNPAEALKAEENKGGFFGKLFGGDKTVVKPEDFRILVQPAGSVSQVSVQAVKASAVSQQSAQNILKVLQQQLQ